MSTFWNGALNTQPAPDLTISDKTFIGVDTSDGIEHTITAVRLGSSLFILEEHVQINSKETIEGTCTVLDNE